MNVTPQFSSPELPESPIPAPPVLAAPRPAAYELPEEMAVWLDAYELASAKIKELEEKKKLARDALVELAQQHGAETLTRDGRPAAKVTTVHKRRFETAKFKTEHADLYDAYTTEVAELRFNLAK